MLCVSQYTLWQVKVCNWVHHSVGPKSEVATDLLQVEITTFDLPTKLGYVSLPRLVLATDNANGVSYGKYHEHIIKMY